MSWELGVALIVSIGIGIIWGITNPVANREWLTPPLILSISMSILTGWHAWNKWDQLRSKLENSPYGELIHLVDGREIKVRAPYLVTRYVAFASAICTTLTAMLIEVISGVLAATLIAVTVMFLVWMILAVLSISFLSSKHDEYIAELESSRQKLEFIQREMRRQGSTQDKDD